MSRLRRPNFVAASTNSAITFLSPVSPQPNDYSTNVTLGPQGDFLQRGVGSRSALPMEVLA